MTDLAESYDWVPATDTIAFLLTNKRLERVEPNIAHARILVTESKRQINLLNAQLLAETGGLPGTRDENLLHSTSAVSGTTLPTSKRGSQTISP